MLILKSPMFIDSGSLNKGEILLHGLFWWKNQIKHKLILKVSNFCLRTCLKADNIVYKVFK